MANRIALIGLRGTGKTTVGKLLAERLAWSFTDADVELETRVGKSIKRMFAEDGEPFFRDREAEVVADLCQKDLTVIATGGGAILRPETRMLLKKSCVVFWLSASVETMADRIFSDHTTQDRRPNLTAQGGIEEIRQLLTVRKAFYQETAHHTIDTDRLTVESIVDLAMQKMG
jgi:shikimate kinase